MKVVGVQVRGWLEVVLAWVCFCAGFLSEFVSWEIAQGRFARLSKEDWIGCCTRGEGAALNPISPKPWMAGCVIAAREIPAKLPKEPAGNLCLKARGLLAMQSQRCSESSL